MKARLLNRIVRSSGYAAAVGLASTSAQGQILRPPPVTAEVRSVADDPRPEWDPLGIPLGSFLVHPSVELGALGQTNVRATPNDHRSDVAAVGSAGIGVESGWARHYLGAEAYATRTQYASLEDESRTEFGARVDARYDIDAVSKLIWLGQYDRLTQPREDINAPDNARTPAQYDRLRGNLSYQFDNSLVLLDADLTVDRRVYRNTRAFSGAVIDQHDRDFTRYQASLRAGYAVSGSLSLVVAGSANKRDFDQLTAGGISRASKGGTLEAGFLWRPSTLLSAEVRAGYLFQNFKSPQLNDASGLSLNARMVWNALPRTSFRLEAARKVSESSSSAIQSQLVTIGKLGVDREILPNLILTAEATYERTKYIGVGRKAEEWSAAIKGRYLLSRLTALTFSVQHAKRTATVPTDRFSGQQAMIGIRFTL